MILSIDVGIKNLAMCLFDPSDKKIHQWDVSGVPPESDQGLFVCMRNLLDSKPWVLEATTVLIEKQPDRNKKMKTVENFLNSYMIIKNPQAETIIYHAKHKIPDVVGAGKTQYRKRKQTSIDRCRDFLKGSETNKNWIEVFNSSKKKDDLADTVMQALSFNVDAPAPSAKKSSVRSRRPTEHQEETKYTKSNLAWFVKNNTKESLKKNKRFMKDLGRYYSSIEQLEECMV